MSLFCYLVSGILLELFEILNNPTLLTAILPPFFDYFPGIP